MPDINEIRLKITNRPIYHLRAAEGFQALGMFEDANAELEKIRVVSVTSGRT